jgi:hypothetical protein
MMTIKDRIVTVLEIGAHIFLLVGFFLVIPIAVVAVGFDERDKRGEVSKQAYQEVFEMDNEHTTTLIRKCMGDGKISGRELKAIRKRFNRASGERVELEKRYGE